MISRTILLFVSIFCLGIAGERLHRWNWKRLAHANKCHCGEVAR